MSEVTKKYILVVYNTLTSKEEKVEVSKEVYDEYRRGKWRMEKDDVKNSKNVIPFSSLISKNGSVDDFREFSDTSTNPEFILFESGILKDAIASLDETEKNFIISLYYDGISTREYAAKINRSQSWVQKKKSKILRKLKKFSV